MHNIKSKYIKASYFLQILTLRLYLNRISCIQQHRMVPFKIVGFRIRILIFVLKKWPKRGNV